MIPYCLECESTEIYNIKLYFFYLLYNSYTKLNKIFDYHFNTLLILYPCLLMDTIIFC